MVKHTSPGRILAHKASIPPLAEQKAIAAVLGALDDKIELNRRMNATLEAMARALFQSWFVDFDPVRAWKRGRTARQRRTSAENSACIQMRLSAVARPHSLEPRRIPHPRHPARHAAAEAAERGVERGITNTKENCTLSEESTPNSAIILDQTEDGRTLVQCRFEDETVWLTQKLMAELFQIGVGTVNLHLKAIFSEGELQAGPTIRFYRIVQNEGARQIIREGEHYTLDAILAVGFRMRSHRGTQFRQWAIGRLNEYLVKGFTMDDERLKNPPGKGQKDYFDEQLERIRDIRSSERRFCQKVLDIYATSVDYTPNMEMLQQFFATVQNKMHWAAHGQTAAEVIHARVDAAKPNMGLMTWPGSRPRKPDVAVAKNYLNEQELGDLNLIVSLYLDFAEFQARSCRVMTMTNWIAKLDDFMRISDREILTHAGKVSPEAALAGSAEEFEKFHRIEDGKPSPVEQHFIEAIEQVKQLEKGKRAKKKSP
jgi:hypothetical protein